MVGDVIIITYLHSKYFSLTILSFRCVHVNMKNAGMFFQNDSSG